jgi:hypothetical protein
MFSKLFNFFPNPLVSFDFIRLKLSFFYIKSIKTFRFLFLSLLGIGVCLVFLTTSLILFHTALFLYSPWSPEVKFWIGMGFAILYFSITLFIFNKVFSQRRWMEIFHADDIGKHKEPVSSNEKHENEEKKKEYQQSKRF